MRRFVFAGRSGGLANLVRKAVEAYGFPVHVLGSDGVVRVANNLDEYDDAVARGRALAELGASEPYEGARHDLVITDDIVREKFMDGPSVSDKLGRE